MPVPSYRVPVRVARGTKAALDSGLASLEEGEICYATDENALYVVEGGVLTAAGSSVSAASIGDLSDVDTTTSAPTDGQVLIWNNVDGEWQPGDSISDVVSDTTPQLGGNLDVNGNQIVSAGGGDIEIAPDTTGGLVVRGNSADGKIKLNCTANTHGVTIQSPPHADAATYSLILPSGAGTAGQVLTSQGGAQLTWEDAGTGGGATSIDDLADVDTSTTAPTSGQVLEWDGTNWVPGDAAGGGEAVTIYRFPTAVGLDQSVAGLTGSWSYTTAALRLSDLTGSGDFRSAVVAVNPSGDIDFYISEDEGQTWTSVTGSGTGDGLRLDNPDWVFTDYSSWSTGQIDPANHTGSYWISLDNPISGDVDSVNGQTGVVSLGIDDLTDVDTSTTAPTNGQVLEWDGTNWVPGDVETEASVSVLGWAIDSDATAATSQVLTAPTHNTGSLLIACVMSRNSGGTLTAPSGWSLHGEYLSSIVFSGDVQTIGVFTKIATASEPTTYTWTQQNSSRICGWIASVDGVSSILSVTESYGNAETASISTSSGYLNLTAATWVYSESASAETYSQSGPGVTEITDSPNDNARISGGYTTLAGTVTSTHSATAADNSPNHGMINMLLGTSSSIDQLSDVDTSTTPPTTGQVLEWDGTNWVPGNQTGGGGAIATTPAPSSPGATGTAGEIKYDSDYIYLAVADNTWKRALLDTWVPAGTIAEVVNYTGNGSTQSITGVGFQPGLIFIRKPSVAMYVVSEATSTLGHFPWGSGGVTAGSVTSLDADGFTLGVNDDINESGVNYTAIAIKTGQSLMDNTGTIQFDYHRIGGCNHGIYTGTGNTSSTYGHGLSVAPEFFVNKRLASSQGYISGNTMGPIGKSLYLASSYFYVNAQTYSTLDSTVVSAGNNNVNLSGQETWSMFCENVGTQTACADVSFGGTQVEEVNFGFTPRFMLFRGYTPQASTTTSGQYSISFYYNSTLDATGDAAFLGGSTSADGISSSIDWTANGFSIAAGAIGNGSGTRALCMAFR